MQYRACGWKTTVDSIKKAKPSNEHLGHELRTSQRLTGWGREKREGVIGFWDQVENPFASCALAHSWSRLLHAGWKCKSRRNPNLHFSATRIGVICGTCEIDRHTYHERPFPGLCVRKTLTGHRLPPPSWLGAGGGQLPRRATDGHSQALPRCYLSRLGMNIFACVYSVLFVYFLSSCLNI